MGKSKKKAWRATDVGEVEKAIDRKVDADNQAAVAVATGDGDLFFEDKQGNTGGRKDKKRKAEAAGIQPKKDAHKAQKKSKRTKKAAAPKAALEEEADAVMSVAQGGEDDGLTVAGKSDARLSRNQRQKINNAKGKQARQAKQKHNSMAKRLLVPKSSNAPELMRDLWADQSLDQVASEIADDHHKGFTVDVTPLVSRPRQYQRNRNTRDSSKAKSLVQATGTEVAGGGSSFNPDEDRRQDALRAAYERDVREEKERKAIHAALNPALNIVEGALPDSDDESEFRPARKAKGAVSQKERRDRKIRHEKDQIRQKEAAGRKQAKQLARLPAVLSDIKKEEKKLVKHLAAIAELKETQPDHRPRVSKHEFKDAFDAIPLEEDLQDRSLRMVTPSLNVVSDQFKSFQQKNIIETRVRVKGLKRRYVMKDYTRNAHKEPNQKWHSKKN